MAWRIEEAVVRGEIDNTTEGRTTGRIWLHGREEPLALDLTGDCWRDLAGARLSFRNPAPHTGSFGGLKAIQRGLVGDMTASRKTRAPLLEDDELQARRANGDDIPMGLKNTLYLEWFSDDDGRVVIESTDFELELGERAWEMDADAEEAQKLANLQAMRDAMCNIIRRRSPDDPLDHDDDDEFAWEQRLQESDRLTDAYQEVLEKYMDDPDSERKEAFVMGWDGLLDALAAKAEGKEPPPRAWELDYEEEDSADSWKDEDDGDDFGSPDDNHPLQEKATELAIRAMDFARAEEGGHAALETLTSSLLQVAGKLAGALNDRHFQPETGFVLAILKRCLNWQNDAMAACGELIGATEDEDQRRAFEALRDSIFEIREEIVNLRRELKGN